MQHRYSNTDIVLDRDAHRDENTAHDVRHLVESWDEWVSKGGRSDVERYVHGDIKFLFEYGPVRNKDSLNCHFQRIEVPYEVRPHPPMDVIAEPLIREIRNLSLNDIAGNSSVVSYWGKQSVLVNPIEEIDRIKQVAVHSRIVFVTRPQIDHGLQEFRAYPMGQSILYSFLKPIWAFAKGELNGPALTVCHSDGRNDFPIRVIQCGPEVVNSVSADERDFSYDGFVFFGSNGALAGICICFENVEERTFFTENFIYMTDVFRGPIKL